MVRNGSYKLSMPKRKPDIPILMGDVSDLGQGGGVSVTTLVVTAVVSAAAGAIGTLLIERLLPAPAPGDGYSVRWLVNSPSPNVVDFGLDRDAAENFARSLRDTYPDVSIVEISAGRIMKIIRVPGAATEKATSTTTAVAPTTAAPTNGQAKGKKTPPGQAGFGGRLSGLF
jgi:hypothetical protein